jgi:hypothetical protein
VVEDDFSELNLLRLAVAEVELEDFACYVDVVQEVEGLPPRVVDQLEGAYNNAVDRDLDAVRISLRHVVGRDKAKASHVDWSVDGNLDPRRVAVCLVPLVPTFLSLLEKVNWELSASAAAIDRELSSHLSSILKLHAFNFVECAGGVSPSSSSVHSSGFVARVRTC